MALEAFLAELGPAPIGQRFMQRHAADTYAKFVLALHRDIEAILVDMERARERFFGQSEDQLTFHIASILTAHGYSATTGTQQSGSVDLTVVRVRRGFNWTAEAKIFTSLTKVKDGFAQLTTRYSPGNFEEAQTGMLIYVQTKNAADKLKTWRTHVEGKTDTTVRDSPTRPLLSFESTQTHETSGLPFDVKHWVVALHFKPQDPSGLNAKRYGPKPSATP